MSNQTQWELHASIHAEVDPILRPPEIYEADYRRTKEQVANRRHYLSSKRSREKYRATMKGRVLEWLRRNQTAIPYAEWRRREGKRQGLTEFGITDRVKRGHYPELRIKKFNNRYTFCWFSAGSMRPRL